MKRRPLCIFCVLFLAVQTIRVLFFGAGDGSSALGQTLDQNEKEIEVILEGIVYRIDPKESTTAVYLKENAVSFLRSSISNHISHNVQKADQFGFSENAYAEKGNDLPQKSQKEDIPQYQQVREKKILIYIKKEDTNDIRIGNVLRIRGDASAFESARNPGNFDQRFYYRKQGIYASVWAEEVTVRSRKTDRVSQFLHEFRQRWKQLLIECLGEYYGNTMSAVLLGEKGQLDPNMKRLYQKNGIGHILAISGLHMSFIGSGIYRLLRRSGAGFALSGIAGGAVLIFYTVMVGAGVSSMRALLMFLVRMGAEVTGRDYDLPTSLSLAGAVICAKEPLYLLDAGFQLSFGALWGICLFNPLFETLLGCGEEKHMRVWKDNHMRVWFGESWLYVKKGLCGSLAVNVFLLGPMLYFYFEIPPYSVLLNLLVIPMLPVAMGAGLAGSAAAIFIQPVGAVILKISSVVLWAYDGMCSAMGGLPFGRIVAGRPDRKLLAAYYAGLFLFCGIYYLVQRKNSLEGKRPYEPRGNRFSIKRDLLQNRYLQKRLCGCCIVFLAVTFVVLCKTGHRHNGEMSVTMLDVGQGDGIFIAGEENYYMIDGGSSDVKQVGVYRIEPYLLSQGVDHLDYVFVTHGDEDHISGIRELLERQELGIRVEMLVLPPQEYHDEKLEELADAARKYGTRVAAAKVGTQIAERKTKSKGAGTTAKRESAAMSEKKFTGMAAQKKGEGMSEKKLTGMAVQKKGAGMSANKESEGRRTEAGLTWTCIAPLSQSSEAAAAEDKTLKLENGNEASLVLDLSYRDFDMIFTGDVEGAGEELLTESGLLREYDVLKCAHHGSKNSGMDGFLDRVNPKAALISAGESNRYGHPHKETLARLKERNVRVYNTQQDGAVTIRSDGRRLWIQSFVNSD